jgi:hypothetical protein
MKTVDAVMKFIAAHPDYSDDQIVAALVREAENNTELAEALASIAARKLCNDILAERQRESFSVIKED